MGGLLAADAATDPSNNPDRYPGGRPKRIIGVVAFDTPYLGMHPHVVISGIASLLPKGDEGEKKGKSESMMNEHPHVNVVDEKVTDDWEAFKKQAHGKPCISFPLPLYFMQNYSTCTERPIRVRFSQPHFPRNPSFYLICLISRPISKLLARLTTPHVCRPGPLIRSRAKRRPLRPLVA